MNDLGAERADHTDILMQDCLDKILNFRIMFHDISGNCTAVDEIYRMTGRRVQNMILVFHLGNLTDFTQISGFFKPSFKFLKLCNRAMLQKINNSNIGLLFLFFIGAV